jgi:hypothetical protein
MSGRSSSNGPNSFDEFMNSFPPPAASSSSISSSAPPDDSSTTQAVTRTQDGRLRRIVSTTAFDVAQSDPSQSETTPTGLPAYVAPRPTISQAQPTTASSRRAARNANFSLHDIMGTPTKSSQSQLDQLHDSSLFGTRAHTTAAPTTEVNDVDLDELKTMFETSHADIKAIRAHFESSATSDNQPNSPPMNLEDFELSGVEASLSTGSAQFSSLLFDHNEHMRSTSDAVPNTGATGTVSTATPISTPAPAVFANSNAASVFPASLSGPTSSGTPTHTPAPAPAPAPASSASTSTPAPASVPAPASSAATNNVRTVAATSSGSAITATTATATTTTTTTTATARPKSLPSPSSASNVSNISRLVPSPKNDAKTTQQNTSKTSTTSSFAFPKRVVSSTTAAPNSSSSSDTGNAIGSSEQNVANKQVRTPLVVSTDTVGSEPRMKTSLTPAPESVASPPESPRLQVQKHDRSPSSPPEQLASIDFELTSLSRSGRKQGSGLKNVSPLRDAAASGFASRLSNVSVDFDASHSFSSITSVDSPAIHQTPRTATAVPTSTTLKISSSISPDSIAGLKSTSSGLPFASSTDSVPFHHHTSAHPSPQHTVQSATPSPLAAPQVESHPRAPSQPVISKPPKPPVSPLSNVNKSATTTATSASTDATAPKKIDTVSDSKAPLSPPRSTERLGEMSPQPTSSLREQAPRPAPAPVLMSPPSATTSRRAMSSMSPRTMSMVAQSDPTPRYRMPTSVPRPQFIRLPKEFHQVLGVANLGVSDHAPKDLSEIVDMISVIYGMYARSSSDGLGAVTIEYFMLQYPSTKQLQAQLSVFLLAITHYISSHRRVYWFASLLGLCHDSIPSLSAWPRALDTFVQLSAKVCCRHWALASMHTAANSQSMLYPPCTRLDHDAVSTVAVNECFELLHDPMITKLIPQSNTVRSAIEAGLQANSTALSKRAGRQSFDGNDVDADWFIETLLSYWLHQQRQQYLPIVGLYIAFDQELNGRVPISQFAQFVRLLQPGSTDQYVARLFRMTIDHAFQHVWLSEAGVESLTSAMAASPSSTFSTSAELTVASTVPVAAVVMTLAYELEQPRVQDMQGAERITRAAWMRLKSQLSRRIEAWRISAPSSSSSASRAEISEQQERLQLQLARCDDLLEEQALSATGLEAFADLLFESGMCARYHSVFPLHTQSRTSGNQRVIYSRDCAFAGRNSFVRVSQFALQYVNQHISRSEYRFPWMPATDTSSALGPDGKVSPPGVMSAQAVLDQCGSILRAETELKDSLRSPRLLLDACWEVLLLKHGVVRDAFRALCELLLGISMHCSRAYLLTWCARACGLVVETDGPTIRNSFSVGTTALPPSEDRYTPCHRLLSLLVELSVSFGLQFASSPTIPQSSLISIQDAKARLSELERSIAHKYNMSTSSGSMTVGAIGMGDSNMSWPEEFDTLFQSLGQQPSTEHVAHFVLSKYLDACCRLYQQLDEITTEHYEQTGPDNHISLGRSRDDVTISLSATQFFKVIDRISARQLHLLHKLSVYRRAATSALLSQFVRIEDRKEDDVLGRLTFGHFVRELFRDMHINSWRLPAVFSTVSSAPSLLLDQSFGHRSFLSQPSFSGTNSPVVGRSPMPAQKSRAIASRLEDVSETPQRSSESKKRSTSPHDRPRNKESSSASASNRRHSEQRPDTDHDHDHDHGVRRRTAPAHIGSPTRSDDHSKHSTREIRAQLRAEQKRNAELLQQIEDDRSRFQGSLQNVTQDYEAKLHVAEEESYRLSLQLKAKVAEDANLSYRKLVQQGVHLQATAITQTELDRLQREMKHLDSMIEGLNRDNTKLRLDAKVSENRLKTLEHQAYLDQRELKQQIADLEQQLKIQTERPSVVSGTAADKEIRRLQDELRRERDQFRNRESMLQQQVRQLQDASHKLSVTTAASTLGTSSVPSEAASIQLEGGTSNGTGALKQEITQLKGQLKWFAENQPLVQDLQFKLQQQHSQLQQVTAERDMLAAQSATVDATAFPYGDSDSTRRSAANSIPGAPHASFGSGMNASMSQSGTFGTDLQASTGRLSSTPNHRYGSRVAAASGAAAHSQELVQSLRHRIGVLESELKFATAPDTEMHTKVQHATRTVDELKKQLAKRQQEFNKQTAARNRQHLGKLRALQQRQQEMQELYEQRLAQVAAETEAKVQQDSSTGNTAAATDAKHSHGVDYAEHQAALDRIQSLQARLNQSQSATTAAAAVGSVEQLPSSIDSQKVVAEAQAAVAASAEELQALRNQMFTMQSAYDMKLQTTQDRLSEIQNKYSDVLTEKGKLWQEAVELRYKVNLLESNPSVQEYQALRFKVAGMEAQYAAREQSLQHIISSLEQDMQRQAQVNAKQVAEIEAVRKTQIEHYQQKLADLLQAMTTVKQRLRERTQGRGQQPSKKQQQKQPASVPRMHYAEQHGPPVVLINPRRQ